MKLFKGTDGTIEYLLTEYDDGGREVAVRVPGGGWSPPIVVDAVDVQTIGQDESGHE